MCQNMDNWLINNIKTKNIFVAGYGIEGKSTTQFLLQTFPDLYFTIADEDPSILMGSPEITNNPRIKVITGITYLQDTSNFDLIIKSPGISLSKFPRNIDRGSITSQTELFIHLFSSQIIGITGTKGKSTTTSLLFHILDSYHHNTILVGNIGTPPLDLYSKINEDTKIIFELSSYQLEALHQSPHIAVLLNLYQEHLDRYKSFSRYQQVKFNIIRFQKKNDIFIYNDDDNLVKRLIVQGDIRQSQYAFSIDHPVERGCYIDENGSAICSIDDSVKKYSLENIKILGEHNRMNIISVILICNILKVPDSNIISGIESFKGLSHRLEYVGKFSNVHFYNDSIATIPEATIHAVNALNTVNTLILGGYDRGIDYSNLMLFLAKSSIKNLIFMGPAGKRMMDIANQIKMNFDQNLFFEDDMEIIIQICKKNTEKDTICLLSPAAASYGLFDNFEERGDIYKKMAKNQ